MKSALILIALLSMGCAKHVSKSHTVPEKFKNCHYMGVDEFGYELYMCQEGGQSCMYLVRGEEEHVNCTSSN